MILGILLLLLFVKKVEEKRNFLIINGLMVRKLLLWKEELHYASKVIFLNVFNIGNTITNPPPNPLFHIHLHLAVSRTGGELPLWR